MYKYVYFRIEEMSDKLQIVNRLLKAVNETLEFFDHTPTTYLYDFHKVSHLLYVYVFRCILLYVCICMYVCMYILA